MPRLRYSISLRLTLGFGGILLTGWLLFGAAMWGTLKYTLTNERHLTLSRRIDRLQDLLHRDATLDVDAQQADFRDFAAATGGGLMQINLTTGVNYWPAPSSASSRFPWPDVSNTRGEVFLHMIANGQPHWVLIRHVELNHQSVVIMAAASEASNLLILNRFCVGLFASAPVLLLIAMAGGYWMSRRALHPVDRITAAAHSIGIRNLSERLPVAQHGDELQRLAETCNQMLERLEVAVRKLKQFTADASHELRGPLSLIRTIAEVSLRQQPLNQPTREALQEIADEATRAAELLEEMLELARIDAEPIDIALEPVDLTQLLHEACSNARTLCEDREIALSIDASAQPAAIVLGHAPSLRRLMWILLDNAIKYTQPHGKVIASLQRTGSSFQLNIADNGIGIAPSHLPHIFDRFYRADPARTDTEGNGLGLAIAKWIAEMHHATIQVESREGAGTSFSVAMAAYLSLQPTARTQTAAGFDLTQV